MITITTVQLFALKMCCTRWSICLLPGCSVWNVLFTIIFVQIIYFVSVFFVFFFVFSTLFFLLRLSRWCYCCCRNFVQAHTNRFTMDRINFTYYLFLRSFVYQLDLTRKRNITRAQRQKYRQTSTAAPLVMRGGPPFSVKRFDCLNQMRFSYIGVAMCVGECLTPNR